MARAVSLLSMIPIEITSCKCLRFFLMSWIPALSPGWAILSKLEEISRQSSRLDRVSTTKLLLEPTSPEQLRMPLRTTSSCWSTEHPCLSLKTKVSTAPSCHPEQFNPRTQCGLPTQVGFAAPEPRDHNARVTLQQQLEKAAKASLSLTNDHVNGRTCQGIPYRILPSIPDTTSWRIRDLSCKPNGAETMRECMTSQCNGIRRNPISKKTCGGG